MELLKFLTCGSVDDGKSTLIGHMLYSAKLIFADQKQALELDSKIGSVDGNIDYALLLDGLEAEREQRITIDVAYRFFSTDKRSFIVADAPGHVEYTRNMAVGASFADLAIILLDVKKGVLTQTRRHARICALMGIRDFVFAVNKMDLVGYDQQAFETADNEIVRMLENVSKEFDFTANSVTVIPVSALKGDNLVETSEQMPWYTGPSLLQWLESVNISRQEDDTAFCMPVQRASRPNASFRGFQGEIISGAVHIGDGITVYPSGEKANISRIISSGRETVASFTGEAITLCLDREVDISRGCVIASESKKLHIGRSFAAYVLWMNDTPLNLHRNFLRMQIGTSDVSATVKVLKYIVDIDTGEHSQDSQVRKNELAVCELETGIPVAFDEFNKTQRLGEFILIDPVSNATAACGIVLWALGENGQIYDQPTSITRPMRERMNGHRGVTIWLTGLSGAGKSTIADSLETALFHSGIHTMLLDGDNLRSGLCKNLSFSPQDRTENIRRVAEAAKLLNDAGIVSICAFVSPMESDRKLARNIIRAENFIEVYVNASVEECIKRDTKGLYLKAQRGEIREFTGISSPYEPPLDAELTVNADKSSVAECRDVILKYLRGKLEIFGSGC